MLSRILRAFQKWELIGENIYGKEDMQRVPPWVKEQIDRIYRHGSGSSLGLRTYYLKGKTYRYRLAFSGQGGPMLHVYRRRRAR